MDKYEGILPLFKPAGLPSFRLISLLRKATAIRKIGHSGTLDPFAQGVMILLIGRSYTKRAQHFLAQDKEYRASLLLGKATDTFDCEGKITAQSPTKPTLETVKQILTQYQGTQEQVPPMFSAKKVGGKRLYQLARQGIEVPRKPAVVTVQIALICYVYPKLELQLRCSKGTYIRSLAHDIGLALQSFAHLKELTRTKNGEFTLDHCLQLDELEQSRDNILKYLHQAPL